MRFPMKVERVRERMNTLGQTQQELALRCLVDLRTLQRWLSGTRVNLGDAERVACALGMGTAELFEGVPSDSGLFPAQLRGVLRLLSAREGDFAQGLRLSLETYAELSEEVSFAAHPARGYVWRFMLSAAQQGGFVPFRMRVPMARCTLSVRAQIGRRLSYRLGHAEFRDDRVEMLEVFNTRSMLAQLSSTRELDLYVWGSGDRRELVFICDQPVELAPLAKPVISSFDLAAPGAQHALCFRPGPVHLRAAGLPMGFDRMLGPRGERVDVAIVR
ncbi:MAG TPA: helix-turn-helix transcriptional regulator [Polyangiales bacterium]